MFERSERSRLVGTRWPPDFMNCKIHDADLSGVYVSAKYDPSTQRGSLYYNLDNKSFRILNSLYLWRLLNAPTTCNEERVIFQAIPRGTEIDIYYGNSEARDFVLKGMQMNYLYKLYADSNETRSIAEFQGNLFLEDDTCVIECDKGLPFHLVEFSFWIINVEYNPRINGPRCYSSSSSTLLRGI